jgi:hypothetical protein
VVAVARAEPPTPVGTAGVEELFEVKINGLIPFFSHN